jgi:hypothetical protein
MMQESDQQLLQQSLWLQLQQHLQNCGGLRVPANLRVSAETTIDAVLLFLLPRLKLRGSTSIANNCQQLKRQTTK